MSTKATTRGETLAALLDAAKLVATLPEHESIEVEADGSSVWVWAWDDSTPAIIDALGPFDLSDDDGNGHFCVVRIGLVRIALDRSAMVTA